MKSIKQDAFQFILENQTEMIDLWEKLVNTNSGPDNKKGADDVSKLIIEALGDISLNIDCIKYENSGNLMILEHAVKAPKGTLLLVGHSDTVFSLEKDQRKFRMEHGKAYGPGVLDMKGGLVIGTYVLKALAHIGYSDYNIKFCIAGDEETAHMNSDCDRQIVNIAKDADAAFTLETGFLDNSLVVARKGGLMCQVDIKGVAAHTGNNPDKGRNAIWEMANKIDAIQKLSGQGILYNVGKVSGGIGVNTFPDSASFLVGVRYSKVEHEKKSLASIEAVVNTVNIKGTSASYKFLGKMQPMEKTEGNLALFELIKQSAQELGMPIPTPEMIGGASDSAYTVIAGVPSVCALGVQGEYNHAPEEYADIKSLYERANLLLCSILNYTTIKGGSNE